MEFECFPEMDEGLGLPSLVEDGVMFLGDLASFAEQISNPTYVEADTVYLLLPKDISISRATRFQWYLDHLNEVVSVSANIEIDSGTTDMQIISIIPKEPSCNNANKFLITTETQVQFIAHAYRFVYCIDMSPSQSVVDTVKNEILFDELLDCFKITLSGICREFVIPGTLVNFTPDIYLTVIVNTPFFVSPAQQVLIKGVKMSSKNVEDICNLIQNQFYFLEGCLSRVAALAHDEIATQRNENEGIIGSLFYLNEPKKSANVPIVIPDVNFVNMLRYSMLAISLLPENSLSHIIVITDGVVAMPDSTIMESLILQLHYDGIPLSFLRVGSPYHPHAPAGFIAYPDLLAYMSEATLGCYLDEFPSTSDCTDMNTYHKSYLLWNFHSKCKPRTDDIFNENNGTQMPLLLSKRQTEDNINASVLLLLSRRMREGYTVDYTKYDGSKLEICMSLEWKAFIYIQYHITCQWPMMKNIAHIEVYILAPYEFLHDISYFIRKDVKSSYRQAAIERFWLRLTQLSSGDTLLAQQLSTVHNSTAWHTLPESIRNGIPVFNLNDNDSLRLSLSPSHGSCTKFVSVWQPICQIESSSWKKWFHTNKMSVILKYDHPLPKHLHLANSSGRFQVIQCRQAAVALHSLLGSWSSFVLIDNHTYLKFLFSGDERNPTWFCMIRVTSKYPCAILHLAFNTGTPGFIRRKVYEELRMELSSLYLTSPSKMKENACCTILQKPLERILIRYERMPGNFFTVVFPDGTQSLNAHNLPSPHPSGSLFTTLSRYLYHRRWVWSTSYFLTTKLDLTAISRILNTLTRMRLKEGFDFAHSCSGVLTMVLELPMDSDATCLVQYVFFPPSNAWRDNDFTSSSDEDLDPDSETDPELQMVTEVWIEPQYGRVHKTGAQVQYFDNKCYYEVANVIYNMDSECINSLLCLEQLSLLCQSKTKSPTNEKPFSLKRVGTIGRRRKTSTWRNSKNSITESMPLFNEIEDRIQHVPFMFDSISILPLCQQTEMLFSMFMESPEHLSVLDHYDYEKSNKLLLENLQEHMSSFHDYELDLSVEQSNQFSQQILSRHRNNSAHQCPINCDINLCRSDVSRWRCFVKGVSVTHIILTFIPACLSSLKELTSPFRTACSSSNESSERTERACEEATHISDASINSTNELKLPLYVYDCPLAMLVDAYVNKVDKDDAIEQDIYVDHRFKFDGARDEETLSTSILGFADFRAFTVTHTVIFTNLMNFQIRLKGDGTSPESKLEDSESADLKNSVQLHCKTLFLSFSKCFVQSLFTALQSGAYIHSCDVQSAMDLCDESVHTIDITDYLKTVCGHLKYNGDNEMDLSNLHLPHLCNELKPLHRLIKSKFFEILNLSFCPVSSNKEFYYYRSLNADKTELKVDSDDEISLHPLDTVHFRSAKARDSLSDDQSNLVRMESTTSVFSSQCISPLFLQLLCTLHYDKFVANTSVKVLPTCLGELVRNLNLDANCLKKSNVVITLDIVCLTLPTEVENVISDYTEKGLRATSFCSDGFSPSVDSVAAEPSFQSDFSDQLSRIPELQQRAIENLQDKIKWLLKDEMATALLDREPVSTKTLNFVKNHVQQSSSSHSCVLEKIDLNFVYGSQQSYDRFISEFMDINIPNHTLKKEKDFYYIVKSVENPDTNDQQKLLPSVPNSTLEDRLFSTPDTSSDALELPGEINDDGFSQSDISSVNDSCVGTDGGYDEDISGDDEDFQWLVDLDERKHKLPNFWLIMKIEHHAVAIYFHCRFLELRTTHVVTYLQVQRAVRHAVRDLCKRVNQSLLLQALNDSRICDIVLEPDDEGKEWHVDNPTTTRNSSFIRLRSMDETSDECESASGQERSQYTSHFKPGEFSCPVVWESRFNLHPRLKSGAQKSSLSRGILALKTVLDKFSVSNRSNMFVYQDNNSNVFYLRLHENFKSPIKSALMRSNEYEHTIVSRSPSIASLPLGHQNNLTQSQYSISSTTSRESSDIRPRVRSFGENESKDHTDVGDTLILKVHGITEAGEDVKSQLVQVLQNRLDDAVLEFLSVMLARNAMCPLTPEDVQFLQKPFRPPETCFKLSIQEFALNYLDAFVHYLRQNLLQFLNIPKYADSRSLSRFKDYSDTDQACGRYKDEHIFIYNQGQNPSSGSKGIACIALAVITKVQEGDASTKQNFDFKTLLSNSSYENILSTSKLNENELNKTYLEFRLWKQGRVNTDILFRKLGAATSQAMWDIIMEYYLLQSPLSEPDSSNRSYNIVTDRFRNDEGIKPAIPCPTEIECYVPLNMNLEENIDSKLKEQYELSQKTGDVPKVLVSRHHKQHRYIPLNSTARRILTFDEAREKEYIESVERSEPDSETTAYKLGEKGVLTEIYSKTISNWLEFAVRLSVPSVRKTTVSLCNRHMLNTTIKELNQLVNKLSRDITKVFSQLPLEDENNMICGEIYIPYNPQSFPNKCIMITRNFDQWQLKFVEHSNSSGLKHLQKFTPFMSDNLFIPRQKLFCAVISDNEFCLYTYNWSKDSVDKLIEHSKNIGLWLSMRATMLNSLAAQKMGIFYNQPITRKNFTPKNSYLNLIGDVDFLRKFPGERNRRQSSPVANQSVAILEAFRDTFHPIRPCNTDLVVLFAAEIQEIKRTDKKHRDELKKLHAMWHSRTSTCTGTQIQILKQNARLIHFCHTPLLFLSRWRIESASTRDHSLSTTALGGVSSEQFSDLQIDENLRMWHNELCNGFISEYKQYLQTLGFLPLQIESAHKRHSIIVQESDRVFYLQKAMLGGIMIFTISLDEPFCITKVYAIECNRLQTTNSRTSINQFTLSFLDECDRMKVLIHLHSFTYDFHLRCVHNYISNNTGVKVCEGYHLTHFLDNFMKYYNKAPNFARNLVHEETMMIVNLLTDGQHLYDYLLSNVSRYNMDVLRMQETSEEKPEFVLVQVTTTPQMCYKDSQDFHHTDDFDVTLIVCRVPMHESNDNVLCLKYYLILTSRREIYPKLEVDRKLGKFRTVSSTFRSISVVSSNDDEMKLPFNDTDSENDNSVESSDSPNSTGEPIPSTSKQETAITEDRSKSFTGSTHFEIKQESVNYLGYYSSHEQLMQQLILDLAHTTRKKIRNMVDKGMVDCRTNWLWNVLVSPQEPHLTYNEFMELKSLASHENLWNTCSNLRILLNQPLSWYQGLAKLLLTRYHEQNYRIFVSPDGNIQHYVILHPRSDGAFILLSLDLHTARGNLSIVYRPSNKQETDVNKLDLKAFLDGFIRCICFYIWSELL